MKLTSDFSWSPARSRVYSQCGLNYYLAYLLGPNGWRPDASPWAKTAYKIGHITSLPLEIGNVVHRCVKGILIKRRNGIHIDSRQEKARASAQFLAWYESSRSLTWDQLGFGNRQLLEHFEGREIAKEVLEEAVLDIQSCLTGFFQSTIGKNALLNPHLLIPQLIDPDTFNTVLVDGVPLLTRTDAVLRGNKVLTVIDWKTGRVHHSHKDSATLQELYIRAEMAVPAEWQIKTALVYLPDAVSTEIAATEEDKSNLLLQAKDEYSSMTEDHGRIADGTPPLQIFPPRPNPFVCRNCSFKVFCPYAKTK